MDEEHYDILEKVFWEYVHIRFHTSVSYDEYTENDAGEDEGTTTETIFDEFGNEIEVEVPAAPITTIVEFKTLEITITTSSVEEVAQRLEFTEEELASVQELLDEEDGTWSSLSDLFTNLIISVDGAVGTFDVTAYADVAETVFRGCVEEGYSVEAACGILGNIQQECSMNPHCSSGGSYGLCQWLGGRLDALKRLRDYTSAATQTGFLLYELEKYPSWWSTYGGEVHHTYNGKKINSLSGFKDCNDPQAAAGAFCIVFERPGEFPGNHWYEQRLKYAQSWYEYAQSHWLNTSGAAGTAGDILDACQRLANVVYDDNNWHYHTTHYGTFQAARSGSRKMDCAKYVSYVLQDIGILSPGQTFYSSGGGSIRCKGKGTLKALKRRCEIIPVGKKVKDCASILQPGDICCMTRHTCIFSDSKGGDLYWFRNDLRRRNITVKKSFSGNPDFSYLSDADKQFQFTLSGTTLLGTAVNKTVTVTGAGSYTFQNVHPGDYTITETATSVWKTVSVKSVKVRENSVQIDSASTDTETFTNTLKTMPVRIHKVDPDGSALAGAEFAVYQKRDVDSVIAGSGYASSAYAAGSPEYYTEFFAQNPNASISGREITTDSNGYGQSTALPCGTYLLRETHVPSQRLDAVPVTLFSITTDAEEDRARGGSGVCELGYDMQDPNVQRSVLITKLDADTGKVVQKAGTSYLIYRAQNGQRTEELYTQGDRGTQSKPWVSAADGTIRVDGIPYGDYCVVEAQAVNGYRNLYAVTGETQPGAFFSVTSDQPSERVFALKDGTLTSDLNLDADRYQRDHTGAILTYELIRISCTNPETRGKLTIRKTGKVVVNYKDGQFVYEEQPLDGAAYRVTAAEDIKAPDNQTVWYHSGDEIAVAVTGPTGAVRYLDRASYTSGIKNQSCPYAAVSNAETGEVSLTLPLGKYTVTEIHAPEGYELNAASQQAELVWQDQEAEQVEATVSFENELKKVHGDLKKTDLDSEQPMEGVRFGVYNASDLFAEGKVLLNADTLLGTVTTDENGCARTESLPFYLTRDGKEGKYYLLESEPVMRYEPNTEKYYFPNRDREQPFRVDAQNILAAHITIEKDQSLNGGERTRDELKVLPDDVITYYVTVTCDADNKRPATDMTITDTIPEGLSLVDGTISGNGVLDENTITWTVDKLEVGESATVSFACSVPVVEGETHYHNAASCLYKLEELPSNEVHAVERLGSIRIIKYKGEGAGKLEGVTFTLSKPDGTLLDTQVTDRTGQVKFSLLPAHDETYIVRETNTVNGYQLLAEPITVTLPLTLTQEELEQRNADPDMGYYDEETKVYRYYDLSYEVRNGTVFDLPLTGAEDGGWKQLLLALPLLVLAYFAAFSDTFKQLFRRNNVNNQKGGAVL